MYMAPAAPLPVLLLWPTVTVRLGQRAAAAAFFDDIKTAAPQMHWLLHWQRWILMWQWQLVGSSRSQQFSRKNRTCWRQQTRHIDAVRTVVLNAEQGAPTQDIQINTAYICWYVWEFGVQRHKSMGLMFTTYAGGLMLMLLILTLMGTLPHFLTVYSSWGCWQ